MVHPCPCRRVVSIKEVTLVVPSYNRSALVARNISSWVNQESLAKLLLVDDASDKPVVDTLPELYRRNQLVEVIRMHTRGGVTKARNEAIRRADTAYVCFCDDDIELPPGYIKELLANLGTLDADVVAARCIYMLDGESQQDARFRVLQDTAPPQSAPNSCWFAPPGYSGPAETPFCPNLPLGRTEVFKAVLYDEVYAGNAWGEELDFYLRAIKRGLRVYFIPGVFAFHLPRGITLSGGHSRNKLWYGYWTSRNNWILLRRHYDYFSKYAGMTVGPVRAQWNFVLSCIISQVTKAKSKARGTK